MLFVAMLLLGAIIGFVGAGGAGVTIALLTAGFNVPIHTALAVALSAMVFTMLSGTISHFREGEVVIRTGAVIGIWGMVGAMLGAEFADGLDGLLLHNMTGGMLLLSAFTLYMKLYHADFLDRHFHLRKEMLGGRKLYIYGGICGLVNGFLAGAFGIGAAAFIQLSLMVVFGVPLLQSIGTCMMIILPISVSGGLTYLFNGYLDYYVFGQTLAGLMIGAFFGAKFTHLAPMPLLKLAIVTLPTCGALTLLLLDR